MTFGQRIKEARKKAGLTQKELAIKIGAATGTIQQYELGKRQPRLEQLEAIASALGVSAGYLMGYDEEAVIIPGRLRIVASNNPDLENLQYRIEATDAEAFEQGLKIFEAAGIDVHDATPIGRISKAMERLNPTGQVVAVERVEELTKVPDYQKDPEDK